ncbi:HesA/MoeB/ThiF family protein [Ahrensia kielensis]|uniref:HesA/MoeB/ThiF family protein n=1 Tax=Ahrensia kielensis TaxID=76980 RepID=UPI00036A74D6|nr:molybdopterin-synthase adenylyltransferase MoeB [Ahrensia kielensis]
MAKNAKLTGQEIERYARHIILPEIGGAGQQKLKAARVCIIGAGGLGSPVAMYLAAAGVGTLGIIDDDVVSLSNLQRQIIHATDQISEKKTYSATKTIANINPHVKVIAHNERLNADNAQRIFKDYDIIVDGSDNFETRYLVADQAEALGLPLVAAALGRFDGSLTVLAPFEGNNPRYRDIFPKAPPDGVVPTCAEAGILGVVAGVMGTLQAAEVIKLVTGIGTPLIGQLLLYDALECRFEKMRFKRKT